MTASHSRKFFCAGGFDQVQPDSGADLLALRELDQKLWGALSCPTRDIEFDSRTLDLVDADGGGQVRANEVLAAAEWAGRLLKNADLLVKGADCLVLADINDTTGLEFNGDGVICPGRVADAGLRATIGDIAKCAGTAADLSGEVGISREIADKFLAEAEAYAAWYAKGESDPAVLLLGENTLAAAVAFHAVRDKVGDYFTRCQLAAYDARAAAPSSRAVEDYQQFAAHSLSAQSPEVAGFPLATVGADKPLPLASGINPAWQGRLAAMRELALVPLLGNKDSLTAAEWAGLCARFAAFEAWQATRPANGVEQLGILRLREIMGSGHKTVIDELLRQDKAVAAEVKAIRAVEKLLRLNRDLFKLANNFVSFRSFYTGRKKAVFQVGTLYLDGRSCELCVKVEDVNKHAAFANTSGVCLAYCECVQGAEKMNIAAAFTAGDSDFLMVGCDGVFHDRKGRDWNATIVRIVDHPIGIRQAFWSPYKKLSKTISEQLRKFAAFKAGAVEDKILKAVTENGKHVSEAPATAQPKPPFDVGKFAGIFAAIGLAIGAIGGIVASVVSGILGLKLWQIPLALGGLMLMVSGAP